MEDLKKQGNDYYINESYDKALECYKKAIELSPDNHILYSNISAVYIKKKNFDEALTNAIKSTKINPKWYKSWSRVGTCLMKLNRNDDALISFKKAKELNKEDKYINDMIEKLEVDTEEEDEDINKSMKILPDNMANMPNMSNMPNMPNMPNFNPNMINLFEKMMKNEKISSKMRDANFQKKIYEGRNNPMQSLGDPEILEMMSLMTKEMNSK